MKKLAIKSITVIGDVYKPGQSLNVLNSKGVFEPVTVVNVNRTIEIVGGKEVILSELTFDRDIEL